MTYGNVNGIRDSIAIVTVARRFKLWRATGW
jgi:hypothetical protein